MLEPLLKRNSMIESKHGNQSRRFLEGIIQIYIVIHTNYGFILLFLNFLVIKIRKSIFSSEKLSLLSVASPFKQPRKILRHHYNQTLVDEDDL